MATVKMKKLRLIISRDHVANVICELMLLGCVEVSEPSELLTDPELSVLVSQEESDLETCRLDFTSLTRSLDIIDTHAPDNSTESTERQQITLDKLLFETYPESGLMLAKSLETLDNMLLILPDQDKPEVIEQIIAAANQREDLQLCCDHFSIRISMAETIGKMLGTDYTVILAGWLPAKAEPEVTQRLSQYLCACEFTDPVPGEQESVPALQKSTKLLGRLQNDTRRPFRPLSIRTQYVDVVRGYER